LFLSLKGLLVMNRFCALLVCTLFALVSFVPVSSEAFCGRGLLPNVGRAVGYRVAHPFNGMFRAGNTVTAVNNGGCANGACSVVAVAPVYAETATAQGVANIMARNRRVGHWGGNRGYEGCGMGPTPQAAYAICCYGNSGMRTVDVGYAQDANGMWYCCRRYVN
jgi:hypothetical protein